MSFAGRSEVPVGEKEFNLNGRVKRVLAELMNAGDTLAAAGENPRAGAMPVRQRVGGLPAVFSKSAVPIRRTHCFPVN